MQRKQSMVIFLFAALFMISVLLPSAAQAAGTALVLTPVDKTKKLEAEHLEKYRSDFADALGKMLNLGMVDKDKQKNAIDYVKTKFKKDPECAGPICQQKLLAETGADVVVSLVVSPCEKMGTKVNAVLSFKSKGTLQDKAQAGWIEGDKISVAAQRLAFRAVFNNGKDKGDERRALLMKAIGLTDEELAADMNYKPAKKEEKPEKKKKGDYKKGKKSRK